MKYCQICLAKHFLSGKRNYIPLLTVCSTRQQTASKNCWYNICLPSHWGYSMVFCLLSLKYWLNLKNTHQRL